MASKRIRWVNDNPGAPRDEAGCWTSAEGRFSIEPRYRSTVYPSHYSVRDNMTGATRGICDTVREAKDWAESQLSATTWKHLDERKLANILT